MNHLSYRSRDSFLSRSRFRGTLLGILGMTSSLPLHGGCADVAEVENGDAPEEEASGALHKGLVDFKDIVKPMDLTVCWESSTDRFPNERALVENVVAATWEAYSNARFSGWKACGDRSTDKSKIRVGHAGILNPATSAEADYYGAYTAIRLDFDLSNSLSFRDCVTKGNFKNACIQNHAVHEFGHALGFNHEFDRRDTSDACLKLLKEEGFDRADLGNSSYVVGKWDGSSIMNYCDAANYVRPSGSSWLAPKHTLSTRDIETVQTFHTVPGNPLVDVYKLKSIHNERYVHVDGNGDTLANTLWGNLDDSDGEDNFTRFLLERQDDFRHDSSSVSAERPASYRLRVAGNERFLHVDPSKGNLVGTRYQPDDDLTRFYIERLSNGNYAIAIKQPNEFYQTEYVTLNANQRFEGRPYTKQQLQEATEAQFAFEVSSLVTNDTRRRLWNGGALVNQLSHRCLDVSGSPGTGNGANVALYDCEAGDNSRTGKIDHNWRLTSAGYLQNLKSRRCLDVSGTGRPKNGANVQLWECEFGSPATTDQRWVITKDGFLENQNYTGLCLDVSGAPGTKSGSNVVVNPCEFNIAQPTDQRWFPTP